MAADTAISLFLFNSNVIDSTQAATFEVKSVERWTMCCTVPPRRLMCIRCSIKDPKKTQETADVRREDRKLERGGVSKIMARRIKTGMSVIGTIFLLSVWYPGGCVSLHT